MKYIKVIKNGTDIVLKIEMFDGTVSSDSKVIIGLPSEQDGLYTKFIDKLHDNSYIIIKSSEDEFKRRIGISLTDKQNKEFDNVVNIIKSL